MLAVALLDLSSHLFLIYLKTTVHMVKFNLYISCHYISQSIYYVYRANVNVLSNEIRYVIMRLNSYLKHKYTYLANPNNAQDPANHKKVTASLSALYISHTERRLYIA